MKPTKLSQPLFTFAMINNDPIYNEKSAIQSLIEVQDEAVADWSKQLQERHLPPIKSHLRTPLQLRSDRAKSKITLEIKNFFLGVMQQQREQFPQTNMRFSQNKESQIVPIKRRYMPRRRLLQKSLQELDIKSKSMCVREQGQEGVFSMNRFIKKNFRHGTPMSMLF